MDNFKKSRKVLSVVLPLALFGGSITQTAFAEDNWKLYLKNAYIDRDFDNKDIKDNGSWSQGISLFYTSDYQHTPIKDVEIGLDASLQYAVRLSNDKHVADTIFPFDKQTQEQAKDFYKYGGTLKLKYKDTVVRVGELWLDLPVTSVDTSRQLLTSYLGASVNSKINDKLTLEAGRVTKISPRNEEGFQKFSFTSKGVSHQSDGLTYFDARYQVNENLKAEYYFGNLENIYNKNYLGLDHNLKLSEKVVLNSRFKYFNAQDTGSDLDIDSQNIGLLETVKYGNHKLGLGYQQIIGDAYPLPDGFLPELYFINWNTTGFFKAHEKSYHLVYSFDFKDYAPGLNTTFKYVYGTDFKTADGKKNHESELNFIGNYSFQQPTLKGLGFQYIFIKYDAKHGNDFNENRVFLTYTKKF